MEDWISNTNIYEINFRQYTPEGTINAFIPHLPRLRDMGVQTLWVMPITTIAQQAKKGTLGSYYACADYTGVDPEFGTLEDFKGFVKKAHDMGFKVIMDWVANHTGWGHHWTVTHPDWYKLDEATGQFKKASGMDDIIELDFTNPHLRKAMIEAMKFWVMETAIDGFRCDLAFWVPLDFWIEAKQALQNVKNLFWLAELDPIDNPEYMQVFDAAYTWTWMRKAEQFCNENLPFNTLLQVLDHYNQQPGINAWFTTNHDENSWNGTEYEKYGALAEALAVFSCTWPGLPLVYSGQELPNKKRLSFFEKDVIGWTGSFALHDFYKQLFRLRQSKTLAFDAPMEVISTGLDEVLVFTRNYQNEMVAVAINFSATTVLISLPLLSGLTLAMGGKAVVSKGGKAGNYRRGAMLYLTRLTRYEKDIYANNAKKSAFDLHHSFVSGCVFYALDDS